MKAFYKTILSPFIKCCTAILMLSLLAACSESKNQRHDADEAHVQFAPVINKALVTKLENVADLLQKKNIQNAIYLSNEENKDSSLELLQARDNTLKTHEDIHSGTHELMTNHCAKTLLAFQKKHPGFVEIFITDKHGMNVCQTNKTTDYYQADEKWWQKAHKKGKGKAYFDRIEYDESANSISIPLYLPVYGKDGKHVIGICKAVLDINSVKSEL